MSFRSAGLCPFVFEDQHISQAGVAPEVRQTGAVCLQDDLDILHIQVGEFFVRCWSFDHDFVRADPADCVVESHGPANYIAFNPESGEGIGQDPYLPLRFVALPRVAENCRRGLRLVAGSKWVVGTVP